MASNRRFSGRQHARRNQEWNQRRQGFNSMQSQTQTQRGFGFVPPSVHALITPFMPPQMHVPIPPFANNFMYKGPTPSPWLVMQPPVFFAVHQDPDLHKEIVKQIDYYFSNENLVKDVYLRQNMDAQGWVPVNLIANFNKVLSLTRDVWLIIDVMQTSKVVEVRGKKMRKRSDRVRWLIPESLNVDRQLFPYK